MEFANSVSSFLTHLEINVKRSKDHFALNLTRQADRAVALLARTYSLDSLLGSGCVLISVSRLFARSLTLYKISAFSRLGQVSIQALRRYDQRGLLTPAHINSENGYRYYRLEQLTRLHRLLALKAMGLSLEQISQLLNDLCRSASAGHAETKAS